MNLRYGSICSGIEAASVAWEPLGWKPVFFSEIEKHPSNVLRYHWPDVPNLGDFTAIDGKAWDIDVLVGGTPCQAFSVAGRRQSLEDDRGNLTLKFVELVHESNVPVVVWENVPGVLSTKDNAFGCFVAGLIGSDKPLIPLKDGSWPGFGMAAGPQRIVAWRILDAQYQRVAQRRRRLFLVSFRIGDGRNPGAVLFEPESVPRDTPPSRKTGEGLAPTVTSGPPFSRTGNSRVESEAIVVMAHEQDGAEICEDKSPCLSCNHEAPIAFAQNQRSELRTSEIMPQLTCGGGKPGEGYPAIAIHPHCIGRAPSAGPQGKEYLDDGSAYTMDSRGVSQAVAIGVDEECNASIDHYGPLLRGGQGGTRQSVMTPTMRVRRLTPIECERLQGFPDNHTQYAVDENGKQYTMPNGARYKALGNSMAVPCMAWIGRRIEMVLEATDFSKAVD